MKADKLTITLSILSVLFAGLLYYFTLCDPSLEICKRPAPFNNNNLNETYTLFCEQKPRIAAWFLAIIVFIHFVSYFSIETDRKKWLRAFLKHVIQQDLGGNQYETRITIFREQYGYKFWIKYLWRCILKQKDIWDRLKKIPHPFKKYLIPYMRYSFPASTPSTTYFPISKYTDDPTDSVATMCYKRGETININAPYIQNIKLPNDLNDLSEDELSKVKEYMEKTSMNDYNKLRSIDRRSNHIYSVLIQRDTEEDNMRWGVMVFDKNSDTNEDLNDKLKNVIHSYLKITQFSLKIIH